MYHENQPNSSVYIICLFITVIHHSQNFNQPCIMRWMNNHPPSTANQPPTPTFQKFQHLVLEKKQHPIQNTMPSCEMTHPNPNPKGTLGHPGGSPNRNPGSGLSYEQGDSLGLWPSNPKKQVGLHKNPGICWVETTYETKIIPNNHEISKLVVWYNWPALRITGPCYRGVWMWFLKGFGISKAPILRSHHYKQESFWAGAAAKWAVMSFKDGRIATFSPSQMTSRGS